ncbi:MAG: hypothetical protein JNL73_01945 [Anaerolineales bacterium]|nr:hypothetical protein [Anaerolineales bacterium]
MPKQRRLLAVLLSLACVLLTGAPPPAAVAAPVAIRIKTSPAQLAPSWVAAGFEPVAENAAFALSVDPATLAFELLDKRSGYVWRSNLVEVTKDDKLNKTWTAFAQSGVSIDYLDKKAISKRASITNSEHTLDFRRVNQGFEADLTFTEIGIGLTLRVMLEPEGVQVEVPYDGLTESDPDFRLGVLHVYPFLGATREDAVPGYMFLPDGSGSLIRFAATTKAKNIFYGRYYGPDLGMTSEMPWDPDVNRALPISIPVVGMAHREGENAYLAVVEEGAPYGEIQAHPAGVTTRFNFIYNAFIYNESYFQATNRSGAGVTVLQPEKNRFDVMLHYRFLTGADADYVGMARSYQRYLLDRGNLPDAAGTAGDIGIRLEFLGGEKERVLFWHRFIAMTTVEQMAAILKDLALPNTEVVYYGWQPYGAASMPPEALSVDGNLGSLDQLRALVRDVAAAGGRFSLYHDPQAALFHEGGYSPRNDLALSVTNVNLFGYNRYKAYLLFNIDALERRYAALDRSVAERLEGAGLALDLFGSVAYSDFRDNHELNRVDMIARYQALWAADQTGTAFYLPNDYAFRDMSAYYDIPLSDNGYLFTSEAVPFLQIVLAGHVPTYGPALNFSSNVQEDLLRQADYGVYPAYFLTQDVTAKILNTSSSWIYTSSYAQWSDEVRAAYSWLNDRLGPVRGEPIVARRGLAPDVVATIYANGSQIVVNYGDSAYQAGGVKVGPRDAVLVEKHP